MATAATFPIGHQFFPEESFSSFVALEKPPLVVGDRVVWLGDDEPEHATVRWLGILPEICKGWTAGIEFDNPVGGIDGNWGGQRLFTCKEKHGMIIGLSGLIKEEDFLGNGPVDTSTVPTDVTSVYVVDEEVTIKSGRSNDVYQNRGGEYHKQKSNEKRQQSPIVISDEEDTDEDEESSDSSASSLNSDVDCLAVSKLLKKLENAISGGKADEAAILARDLAFLKIQCLVVLNRKPKEDQHPAPIVVHLFVEDKVSHHGPIPIKIVPSITVGELKKQILHEFEFPIALQRWIIGRKLATDDDTKLSALGVEADGCPVFLYLLSVEDLGVKSKDLVWENGDSTPSDIPSKPKRCKKVVKKRQSRDVMDMNVKNPVRDSIDERDEETNATTAYLGWQCEGCTMINKPTRPGCAMCGSDRPSTYVIPSNYKLSDDELKRIEQEEAQEKALREAENLQRLQNWQLYLDLDDQAIIYNNEVFECSVCFTETQPGQGVQLRDCLHSFCCDCLRNAITHCEDAEVRCLYRDDQYSCDSVLQEREIRALVSEDVLERLLQRSMARAESQAKNSFHCKTPDCQGWCLFEDNANEFLCPVCMRLNCITCRAIHEQLNCRQYQDRLMMLARTDEEAKKTTDAIEVMLQRGEALRCPSCQVIIMKKWGCDWLSCSVCKTEICWVTKGPRWGPMGRGDVSAGCKCGVKGIKCHPNCNYCH